MAKRAKKSLPQPAPPATAAAWRRGRGALLLFTLLLAVYVFNFRLLAAGDSFPTRVLPFSILREGNLDLDEFAWTKSPSRPWPYYVHQNNGHFYSVSPIATSLLITPLYALPTAWLSHAHIRYDDVRFRALSVALERLSAALLVAASAVLVFSALCPLAGVRAAFALTLVYGLGTSSWSISSQALWPHALSELSLAALSVLFLRAALSTRAALLAGAIAGVMVANRPQMIIFAILATVYVAVRERRRLPAFLAVPALVGVALVAYNVSALGHLSGGYGGAGDHFSGPLWEGLAGLLFSPNRGLFVYTPIMLFAFWGAWRVWRTPAPVWLRYLSVGLVLHLLLYAKFVEWWGGYCFGPRYFTDILPALTLFLAFGLLPLWPRAPWRAVAIAFAAWGVFVQSLGAYADNDDWNRTPVPLEMQPRRVWDWSDLQIARALHNGWHPGEILPVLIDAFENPAETLLVELSRDDLRSDVEILAAPRRLAPGGHGALRARLTNRGGKAWPAFSGKGMISVRYLVFALAQWYARGAPLAGVGEVVPLPENLAPGESLEMEIPLTAPAQRGDYEIEVRVSQAIDGRRGIPSPQSARVAVRVD